MGQNPKNRKVSKKSKNFKNFNFLYVCLFNAKDTKKTIVEVEIFHIQNNFGARMCCMLPNGVPERVAFTGFGLNCVHLGPKSDFGTKIKELSKMYSEHYGS